MAAELWLVTLLVLCCSKGCGALHGSRATNLTGKDETYKLDGKAIYLSLQRKEPNDVEKQKHKQKTWCNQCMRGGSRTPMESGSKGTYNENFENEIYEGQDRRSNRRNNSCDVSCEEVEVEEKCYKYGGIMNVEGFEVEKDEGMRERSEVFVSLAVMNELYTDISYGWYYVVNFVYVNFYENLTAELYTMMMVMSALWIWRMRSTRRKKVRRSHLGCYEKKVVLWVPVARLEKKRQRLQELCLQKKVKVVLWLSMMGSAQAMQEGMQGGSPVASGSQGERVFLERVTSLTEAATAAANAAAQALSSMQSRSSTGLESATRILKSPDVFTGEDPMVFQTWKFQFSSWLSFGDQRFQEVLEKVEALRDDPADTSSFTTEEKELSTKLYTVLATYLKGRCFNMVKAGMKAKNGFLLWRQLHEEFLPSTRQRTLALAQALSAYPTFPKEKSSLECVLAFEQMVQQFEESSMSSYPDELKLATLIRCCHAKVREYLQLTVTDSTTYGDIREAILSHDRASKVWSQETVLRSFDTRTS